MYSLDQIVARPPLSALLSLLLIAGCDALGAMLLLIAGIKSPAPSGWQRMQAPVLGAMALAVVAYPLALAGETPLILLRSIAVVVIAIGLIRTVKLAMVHGRSLPSLSKAAASPGWKALLLLLLTGFVLIALGPVTNADSLDYHIGVAISLINNGGMPVSPEWFSGRLAGNGEVLNALGLSVGAEQFGALLQASGILAIAGLFIRGESSGEANAATSPERTRLMIAAAALSAPVLIELASSAKPQLLPIAMTTCAFALVFFPSRRELPRKAALAGFALVCLLVMTAAQMKLSYTLGGGVIGLIALGAMIRKRLALPALVIGVLSAIVVFGPPLWWKHHYFGATLIDALTKPLPGGWPGTVAFEAYVRGFRESPIRFPLSLFLPAGVGTITTVLGGAVLLLFALRVRGDRWMQLATAAALAVALGTLALGSPNSRSYLEPYFWLLLILSMRPEKLIGWYRWMRWPVALQCAGTILLLWYGVATLLPGALTPALRERVMSHSANGYGVMRWADSVLPPNAVLLNGTRSMALAPRSVVSSDWEGFVDLTSPEARPYLQRLKDRGVTHVLLIGDKPDAGKLRGCLGPVVAGPGFGHTATRNPFNLGARYTAWLVELHSERLPECVGTAPPIGTVTSPAPTPDHHS